MSPLRIASIVEGDGEVEALPVLLRRIVLELVPDLSLSVTRPIRVPRGKMLKEDEFARYLRLAMMRATDEGTAGVTVVLLDADDDCPVEIASRLLETAARAEPDGLIAVVAAVKEFEAWFLASAESLRGKRSLRGDLVAPPDPEAVRNAKGWLQENRTDQRAYSPTIDQPALAAAMDITQARQRSPSFDKLCRDLERLLPIAGARSTSP